MISEITFKFGKGPSIAAEPLALTPVTVFVGPNNSGKSKVLAEIEHRCVAGTPNATDLIVADIKFQGLSQADADLARRPTKVAAIALANKIARMAWAMMARGERYKQPIALAA